MDKFDKEKDARLTRRIQLILLTFFMIAGALITAWLFKG